MPLPSKFCDTFVSYVDNCTLECGRNLLCLLCKVTVADWAKVPARDSPSLRQHYEKKHVRLVDRCWCITCGCSVVRKARASRYTEHFQTKRHQRAVQAQTFCRTCGQIDPDLRHNKDHMLDFFASQPLMIDIREEIGDRKAVFDLYESKSDEGGECSQIIAELSDTSCKRAIQAMYISAYVKYPEIGEPEFYTGPVCTTHLHQIFQCLDGVKPEREECHHDGMPLMMECTVCLLLTGKREGRGVKYILPWRIASHFLNHEVNPGAIGYPLTLDHLKDLGLYDTYFVQLVARTFRDSEVSFVYYDLSEKIFLPTRRGSDRSLMPTHKRPKGLVSLARTMSEAARPRKNDRYLTTHSYGGRYA